LLLTIAALATGVASRAAGSSTAPHIVAKPNSVMVNAKTTITGTGFRATTKLTIEQCSKVRWVVPANPCVRANKISVHTDGHGRFARQFQVELCGGKRGPGPTSQICYIGNPRPEGKDTITLLGAAKVTVTYP
jgi:hypothetical protein